MYIVRFSRQAEKDKKLLKGAGLEKRAKALLNILASDPFQNPPPYEPLVGNLRGFYSRRFYIQHRLVYCVNAQEAVVDGVEYEGTVKAARMWTRCEKM